MKKICVAALLCMISASPALAAWPDDFREDFNKFGIDQAVENALADKVAPNEILSLIISNNELFQTRASLKALYCAGADRNAVRESADQLGITVDEVSKALEESIAECGSKISLSDRDLMDQPASGADAGAGANSGMPAVASVQEAPPPDLQTIVEPATPHSERSHRVASPSAP